MRMCVWIRELCRDAQNVEMMGKCTDQENAAQHESKSNVASQMRNKMYEAE